MSGDMLALVSLFLRNLVLLQLALITLLSVVLLVPYIVVGLSNLIATPTTDAVVQAGSRSVWSVPDITLLAGIVALLVILAACSSQIADVPSKTKKGPGHRQAARHSQRRAKWTNGFWVLLSAFASCVVVVSAVAVPEVAPLSSYVLLGIAAYAGAWLLGLLIYKIRAWPRRRKDVAPEKSRPIISILVTVVAGAVFGLIAYWCAHMLHEDWALLNRNIYAITTFGPPVLLLVISFIVTIHIGTARNLFTELQREWWGRLGGFVIYAGLAWVIIFAVAFYSPPIISWLGKGGLAVVVAWVGASGTGAWIASNATSGSADGKRSLLKPILMRVAPRLFVAGMAVLVSFGLNQVLWAAFDNLSNFEPAKPGTSSLLATTRDLLLIGESPFLPTWANEISISAAMSLSATGMEVITESLLPLAALLISAVAFSLIAAGLDINIFSLHTMYKNRLVRAYLGASKVGRRRPHPFTGFNKGDDIALQNLVEQRPIPILNATINMTGGDDLGWQTRRGASFAFTPRFVGYETKNTAGMNLGGYRSTSVYASGKPPWDSVHRNADGSDEPMGLSLGTAMAISGAAASPNMGYHTSPSIAALLTAFNLRLGYWAGNPGKRPIGPKRKKKTWDAWWKKSPGFVAGPIISELTGSADAESAWVNITDGGHFDNLGIYELVRRRCRFVVVTDAGCDPKHEFLDLAETVRKCWTDLGVHIYFPELEQVALKGKKKRFVDAHGALGLIEYPDRKRGERERYGLMLYLKCSLLKDETRKYVDLRHYAAENCAFPHQTTGDQFFDENQFEAYRHLGFCIAEQYRDYIDLLFQPGTNRLHQGRVYSIAKNLDTQQRADATATVPEHWLPTSASHVEYEFSLFISS